MTTATLGFAVDSSGVLTATPALEKMVAASQKAETAAERLGRSSGSTSGMMKQLAAAVQSIERDLTVLVNRTVSAGDALDHAGGKATQFGNRVAQAGAHAKMMGGSFSGLAAQFQDIGVTAWMGMSPAIIALQQGTQIAGQLELAMANGGKASAVFAQAFASILSPVSLVVIGLTAVAAAAIQMVDWAKVAKGALNGLADGLVVIAPYATVAVAALTMLYAPAIIAGIGSVAAGIWGIGAAILSTVGLPVLLIAGLTALVAAAVIWRDDLTNILGVDIIEAAKDAINLLIGGFVGAYNAVKNAWSNLPVFFAAIGKLAYNNFISEFEKPLLTFNGQVLIGGIDMSGLKASLNAAEQGALKDATATMGDALQTDYLSDWVTGISNVASGAADALRGLADGIKTTTEEDKKAAKEAKRVAEAYGDIVLGANQRIAAAELEARTLGMTTEQINAQRYAQELMNKAANDNVPLTQKQIAELQGLASAIAAAEEQTRLLTEIYDTGKSIFSSFFSDLKTGLREGATLWESLGEAGVNALETIANKALEMVSNGIWDLIFGALSSALFGGLPTAGSLGQSGMYGWEFLAKGGVKSGPGIGAFGNQIVTQPTLFPFAKGVGLMGEAGAEAIMPLRRGPDGRLGVSAANSNTPTAANDYIDVSVSMVVQNGNLVPLITKVSGEVAGKKIRAEAPAAVAASQRNRGS